ncbi:MAG: response regulator transcription factor [Lewinella sp.]|nr:response regulator transcription factor [Lewinella sp.]
MLNCLIIDDEPLAGKLLANYVEKAGDCQLAGAFADPIQALHALEETKVDLIFLDVQMPELTGIQFLKILNGKYPVILTTAYEEYALDGYDFDIIDYLLKPISFDRFLVAVRKARQRLSAPAENTGTPADTPDYIFVKSEYKTQRIDLADLYYLEGMGDYVALHTRAGRILTLEKMKDFAGRLPATRFVRVHRSYIVALDKIEFIERNRIVIQGQRIPISASYQTDFWDRIGTGG